MRGVLITGAVGSGKTSVATEMGEILGAAFQPNAVIDLDWLGWIHPPRGKRVDFTALIAANLADILPRYQATGAEFLILIRALADPVDLARLKRALPDIELEVVHLEVPNDVLHERIVARDSGHVLAEHLEESVSMSQTLASAEFIDHRVTNNARSATQTAEAILRLLGWV
jgi:dephospho-CoA kinase